MNKIDGTITLSLLPKFLKAWQFMEYPETNGKMLPQVPLMAYKFYMIMVYKISDQIFI